VSFLEKTVDAGSTALYLQRNYEIVRQLLAKGLAERGFILEPLKKAVEREWVRKLLWTALPERDVGLSGAFVYVPPGVSLRAPVSTCFVVSEGAQEVHNVLVVGEGSELVVLSTCTSAGKGSLHAGYTEIFLERGAKLDYVIVHAWAKNTDVVAETGVVVGEGASLNDVYISLRSPRSLRESTRITVRRGGSALASSLYLAGSGSSTLETIVTLEEEGASAEVDSKIVAASGSFVSNPITIEAKAPNTRGHVECRGLQLSPDSVIVTAPALRSARGGAQLTHEAAIGKISEEELAYLMTKGFSEEEAASMLVRGFLELGLKSVPEPLKPQISSILDLMAKFATG
jgi:Fe-S cluster assembly scaffold protein SufB